MLRELVGPVEISSYFEEPDLTMPKKLKPMWNTALSFTRLSVTCASLVIYNASVQQIMDFSKQEETLVKDSWEVLKQDIPHYSLRFFTIILEIAPGAKALFSFLKDSDEIPDNNAKLKAHAIKVFKMTCQSAIQLREKGQVFVPDTTLKHLGSVHLSKGVIDPHFEVVKEALLRTLKEAIGNEKWSEELKIAWAKAYDRLADAIKAQMKQEDDMANVAISSV